MIDGLRLLCFCLLCFSNDGQRRWIDLSLFLFVLFFQWWAKTSLFCFSINALLCFCLIYFPLMGFSIKTKTTERHLMIFLADDELILGSPERVTTHAADFARREIFFLRGETFYWYFFLGSFFLFLGSFYVAVLLGKLSLCSCF